MAFVLADVGGTNTRVARANDLKSFDNPIIIHTPTQYQDGIKALCDAVRKVVQDDSIDALAIGIRGSISHKEGTMHDTRVLSDWAGKPLVQDLRNALKTQAIQLENDTALVGLGEAVYGAGKGASIAAYITVSTGVNGVRVVDGQIDRTAQGFEIGGQYLEMAEPRTLESYVAGRRIQERFNKPPRELGADHPVWEELAKTLAFGVHNTILHWSPERVVLGGSMFNEIGIKVDRVAAHVADILKKFPKVPEIVHSQLGDVGGLWGGLALLKQNY